MPQGNHSRSAKGRGVYDQGGRRLEKWRASIGILALKARTEAGQQIWTAPVRLDVEFVMPRPLSLRKLASRPEDAAKQPDRDKLLRAVQDALSGVLYLDDRQVIAGPVNKRVAEWGEAPGVRIIASEIV